MSQPRQMQKTTVRVADIDASRRLRPVSAAGVESLLASIAEVGVMKDAIHVRQKKDGSLVLIAGGHRLEAARRLNWDEIEAKVWTDVTDDWARLMEIDDNLAGAEMNVLDTAVFLAERKRVYEKLHPETKHGGNRGNQHTGGWQNDTMSFCHATAEKFGLSRRQVERIVSAGTALDEEAIGQLRAMARPVAQKDLFEIAKIRTEDERRAAVFRFACGNAKSIADARRSLAQEQDGTVSEPADPAEKEFRDLVSAWKRASAMARRRFLGEFGQDVSGLMPRPEVAAE